MSQDSIKILIAENDPDYFSLLDTWLSKNQNPAFELIRAKYLQSASECLEKGGINLVLLDLKLAENNGLEGFKTLHKSFPDTPIILLTEDEDDDIEIQAIDGGAQDCLKRGTFDKQMLVRSILYAISRHRTRMELKHRSVETESSQRIIRDREERFSSLVANIPGAVYQYVSGENGVWKVDYVSDTMGDITGIPANNFIGDEVSKFSKLVLPQDLSFFQEAFDKAINSGEAFSVDYRIRHVNGEFRWVHDQGRPIHNSEGECIRMDGVISDVTERIQEKERFNRLLYYDALTQLPNRELFSDRLEQSIVQVERRKESGAVLAVDLDSFKRINDTLGHSVGDELIKAVAIRLLKTIYDSDTITRVSGGNFLIILSRLAKEEHAQVVASRILETFKSPFIVNEHELFTTCSIGISIFPKDGKTSSTLIKNADTALTTAKEKGKGRAESYSSFTTNNSFEKLVLENAMRRAIERDEFRLFYQPQVALKSGRVLGVEALIRWQHPDLGFVSPMEFIPLAEETGLIQPIGEWVLKTACKQKRIWDSQGLSHMRVAVNVSAKQFRAVDIIDLVNSALRENKIAPSNLDLELTESSIMDEQNKALDTLLKLKQLGVHLSIDDFGTGYSSFMYLKTFPVDTLKIDRSFIKDITIGSEEMAITQAIISMGHSLKMEVLAEGAETKEQVDLLKEQGCDTIQGYFYSKPVPPDEIPPFVAKLAAINAL